MYTVFVKKDEKTVVPVAQATLEGVVGFCAGRSDIERVMDAAGNAVELIQVEATAVEEGAVFVDAAPEADYAEQVAAEQVAAEQAPAEEAPVAQVE